MNKTTTKAHTLRLIEIILRKRVQCVQCKNENVTHLTMQIGIIKSIRNGTHPKKRRSRAHTHSYVRAVTAHMEQQEEEEGEKKLVQSSNKTYDDKILRKKGNTMEKHINFKLHTRVQTIGKKGWRIYLYLLRI